jgi:thiol-disulfide isomerase/thioredoxin
MRRRGGAVLLVLGALLLAGCTSGNDASAPQGGGFQLVTPGGKTEFDYPAADRKPLGEISGPAVTGDKRVAISDYPNDVIVLNFWGSWCAPCRAEADSLATAATDLQSKRVQFVGINVKDSKSSAADFEAARSTPYPSIFDQGQRTMLSIRGFPVNAIPSTIVLDRQHRVAHIWLQDFKSPAPLVDVVSRIAAES